jgi:peptide/nickel transport system substrate-binding protein
LLDAAGWHLGTDGIRVKNGNRLAIQLATTAGLQTAMTVNILTQAMLHDVGIDASVKSYSSELIFAQAAAHGVLATGTFDLFYATYGDDTDGDTSWLLTCARVEPKGYNESRYCNDQLDAVQAAGLATFDRTARQRDYEQLNRLLVENVPMIFVAWPKTIYGRNPRLHGFVFSGNSGTWNAYQWSLE